MRVFATTLFPTLLVVGCWMVRPSFGFTAVLSYCGSTSRTQQRQSTTGWIANRVSSSRLVLASSSSRDDEIARLEEQLKRLKEEAVKQEPAPETEQQEAMVEPTVAISSRDNVVEYVGRGPAKRPVKPMQEMLSEEWKASGDDADSGSGVGGLVSNVLVGIALAVFLAVFAQVPVGQEDLSRYSTVNDPTTSTAIDLGDLNPLQKTGDL